MGLLIDGVWHDKWYDTATTGGRFVRKESSFRGSFRPEPGRYHLYVSLACPWAHRTLIFRELKGLSKAIDISVVNWRMLEDGWTLDEGQDPIHHARFLHQIYTAVDPNYSGRVTVPVVWDKKNGTIVNNESADIIRMMDEAHEYYPEDLRPEIDAVNARVYDTVNNGVYKAGFATRQEAYREAVIALFDTLDWLEARLAKQRYLCGDRITEADWRLFTTLVRFDSVYVGHFKCNLRRLVDYPNLWGFTRELYHWPGVRGTVNFDHIKGHYYESHRGINPTGIVPLGPILDFDQPHGR